VVTNRTVPCLGGVTSSSCGMYLVEHSPGPPWNRHLDTEPTIVSASRGTLRRSVVSRASPCPQTLPGIIAMTNNGRSNKTAVLATFIRCLANFSTYSADIPRFPGGSAKVAGRALGLSRSVQSLRVIRRAASTSHIIGCRVIAGTPRASAGTGVGGPGLGSAGLRTMERIGRIEANGITTVAAAHRPSPTGHSGASTRAER